MTVRFTAEQFTVNTSDFLISLGVRQPMTTEIDAVVHVPPIVAKQLAMLLRRHVKEFEAKHGELLIPPEAFKALGVASEDW